MSNTPFTDSHNHDAHTPGQMPIVLARLPHVGDEQAKQAKPAPVQTQTVPPPPTPDGVPYVALRDQIEARTQLHIANTPVEEVPAPVTHFVDHKHVAPESVDEPAQTLSMPAVKEARRQSATHSRKRSTQTSSASQSRSNSASFSGKMFQLHARLAPHAGLIVALALIASAGLLYWMIVGPTQTSTTPYETIGSGLQDEVGDITSTMPEDYQPAFTSLRDAQPSGVQSSVVAEVAPVAKPVTSDDQWVTVPLPVSSSPTPEPVKPTELPQDQQTQPLSLAVVAEEAVDSEQVVSSQNITAQAKPLYPTTNNSGSLDFSKLGVIRSSSPSSDAQPVQPELARRPNSSTHR